MPSVVPKILALFCALLAAACARSPQELALSGPTMGTTYTVKVAAPPASVDGARLRETIDDVLAQIDRSMSGYRGDSEVARFNASASTQWYDVSADLAAVVQAALDISEKSGGAFDITVGAARRRVGLRSGGPAAGAAERRADCADRRSGRSSQAPRASRSAGVAQGRRGALDRSQRHCARLRRRSVGRPIAGAARRELHDRHRRRNSRARPQCARRAVAYRHRASSGYAARAVCRRVARRRVDLDLRRISRLLRARRPALFAHHRSSHRAAARSRARVGRRHRSRRLRWPMAGRRRSTSWVRARGWRLLRRNTCPCCSSSATVTVAVAGDAGVRALSQGERDGDMRRLAATAWPRRRASRRCPHG